MKIMGVDFGDARTGLAVCDKTEFLASPVGVIYEKDFDTCAQKVLHMAQEYDVKMIVVGIPRNMDGSYGDRAKLCQDFAQVLRNNSNLPIEEWDERRSTVQATNLLNDMNVRGQKRKEVIDELAAAIILESYLEFRKNNKSE